MRRLVLNLVLFLAIVISPALPLAQTVTLAAAASALPATGLTGLPAAASAHAGHETGSAEGSHGFSDELKKLNIDETTYGSAPGNPVAPRGGSVMPFHGAPVLGPTQNNQVVNPQVTPGTCAQVDPSRRKTFNISAIDVIITLNRFGDNDPQGMMFVLDENLAAVRAQEALPLPGRVSIGLRDDPIQPLVIRANVGDCLIVNFTNKLATGRASINVRGLSVAARTSGGSNVGLNPDTLADVGQTITYYLLIENRREMEGSYVFRSMGDPRNQQSHGLFGVINVEPAGSTYTNPNTGQPQKSGWEAIIVDPAGRDFREDTIIYHEIGDETYNIMDKNNIPLPVIDFLDVYRPGSRALNYRSEPFFRRQELAQTVLGHHDESQSYGSYMFGDPATPFPRGYRGDPTKRRIVHGGSERFHVEHLHGGSIRWPFDPTVEPDFWGLPFDKYPRPQALSLRLDSQSVGPTEAYTIQPEGAAGGLQQGAGEFLFHCHFPHHYIGGMWSFWRVFDTLQTTLTTLPGQPALVELPDRVGQTPAAVNSTGLVGRTLPSGKTLTTGLTTSTTKNIDEWIRSVLPPQGVPVGYDASVWDWVTAPGPIYLSEIETTATWVNYTSPTPGQRREILFNPNNGRPTFPLLRPHLGKRPPFSPGRSGSPWLGEPDPDHPDSLVPSGAPRQQYTVVAKIMPITFNQRFNITDPAGALLVLDEDKDAILAGQKPKEQLTIRANVRDGVDVTYYSEETDAAFFGFAKTNIHIHFVQFDTQASDGVISGFSYDQSVRPYQTEGASGTGIRLTQASAAGSNTITVDDASTLKVNAYVGVGFGVATNQPTGFEFAQISSKTGNTLTLDRQLQKDHPVGQFAGTEFVRYQWYADVEEGTTFFHDHVFGVPGFGKALTGSLIVEPQHSTWHDPVTDLPIRSGTKAVIRTDKQMVPGVPIQDFREFVLHEMGAITALKGQLFSKSEPGGFNMRVEPLDKRLAFNPDRSLVFSSVTHGDPATPLLRAYTDDLVAIRVIQSSGHDMASFHLTGHRFRLERFDPREAAKSSLSIGISERFDLFFKAGGDGKQPGDYIYMNGMEEKMRDGAWGILRVHDTQQQDLLPLRLPWPPSGAGFPQLTQTGVSPPQAGDTGALIPPTAPLRTFNVVAIQKNIAFSQLLNIAPGRAYVLAEDEAAVQAGTKPLEPLVLRANVGDGIRVIFANHLPTARASFHIPELTHNADSQGAAIGFNRDSTVAPGSAITQWYYLDPKFEVPRSFPIRDFGDPINGAVSGLYGAFIVQPAGSTFHDTNTGATVNSGAVVNVRNPSLPGGGFKDVALIFQDDDQGLGRDFMPYKRDVQGIRGINYKAEPFSERLAADLAIGRVLKTSASHPDPRTPLIEVKVGEAVRMHIVGGPGQQPHVFSMDSHHYPFDSNRARNIVLASRQFGPAVTIDVILDSGAGGVLGASGDYLYGDQRIPFLEAGLWGIIRVSNSPTVNEIVAIPNMVSLFGDNPDQTRGSPLGPSWTSLVVTSCTAGVTSIKAKLGDFLASIFPADARSRALNPTDWDTLVNNLNNTDMTEPTGGTGLWKSPAIVFENLLSQAAPLFTSSVFRRMVQQELRTGQRPIPVSLTNAEGTTTVNASVWVVDAQVLLRRGWNLRSTPMALTDTRWGDILAMGNRSQSVGVALKYDPATSKWSILGNNDTISPLDSLYIHATQDDSLGARLLRSPNAVPIPPSKTILRGAWNLVGTAPDFSENFSYVTPGKMRGLLPVDTALNSVESSWTKVVSPGETDTVLRRTYTYTGGSSTLTIGAYDWRYGQPAWSITKGSDTIDASYNPATGKGWTVPFGGYWVFIKPGNSGENPQVTISGKNVGVLTDAWILRLLTLQ